MLAWPERFPRARVKEFEYELGQYAFAGQYQQSPQPRKGGISPGSCPSTLVPPSNQEGIHRIQVIQQNQELSGRTLSDLQRWIAEHNLLQPCHAGAFTKFC
jgi:hypothetical protein